MNKNLVRLVTGISCITLLCASLVGCSGAATGSAAGESSTAYDATDNSQQITVTFMEGDTELGTASANAGEVLSPDSYSSFEAKDGSEFLGWYEAPSFIEASKKDLTTDTFEEDTTLYASFSASEVTEDTRKWYLAGTSQTGPLKDNAWAGDIGQELIDSFELVPTGNAVNEFAITIDLYAGDQFQIIADWSWDTQKGYGLFTELDDTQFESGGSLGGSEEKANVDVLMDGNYTITLTTDPDNSSLDTVVVVRNGDVTNE
ncbi:MAG: hypothetical protein K6G87_19510 [Butyrivibrio sp.]|uniref:hypothetical protein n=1 Tax=Butyrivibrio sp. TaxID=28121 RepID=UPI0025F31C10|nr:hypothetical protein [Butyrivibrio sp.]MCR5773415.1 hypothetical protein [Butyrivibrio sp.]